MGYHWLTEDVIFWHNGATEATVTAVLGQGVDRGMGAGASVRGQLMAAGKGQQVGTKQQVRDVHAGRQGVDNMWLMRGSCACCHEAYVTLCLYPCIPCLVALSEACDELSHTTLSTLPDGTFYVSL